jgi:hypothetical protein
VNVDDFRRERDRLLVLQTRLQGERAMPRDLEGEDVSAPHPGDADHWVAVYDELCRFKRSLIESIREEGATVDPAARAELARDDEALSVELERLQLHLDFWREQLPTAR